MPATGAGMAEVSADRHRYYKQSEATPKAMK